MSLNQAMSLSKLSSLSETSRLIKIKALYFTPDKLAIPIDGFQCFHDGVAMTYRTLMVNLEPGRSNERLLRITGDFAERFDAAVIGIAAYQPLQLYYGDTFVPGGLIEQDRENLVKEISKTEKSFRDSLQKRAKSLEWRSTIALASMAEYVAHQARSADLIIAGGGKAVSLFAEYRGVNASDLVMEAGRPVLIAPESVERLNFENVVIGWKETRESRRAVAAALPALKQAAHVTVVEIASEEGLSAARSHVQDVVGWLKRHDIKAEALASLSKGEDATRLDSIVWESGAGLLIAGAYGHSRMREWLLGGVTRDLLLRPRSFCSLVSH